MSDVFLKLVNLSIAASWLILAVILVRFLLKKAPKWISCVLWALVAFRLVCPFSLESALSLIPSSETINTSHYTARPYIQSGIDIIDNTANSYLGSHYFEGVTVAPSDSPLNPINVISTIWIIGIAVMLLYALISYIRLKKSVGVSIPVKDNIFACDEVKSPFILGIIKPLIYVPSSMEGETLDYVITHEMTHIKRRDHWWKPFGFLLLAVYWFNPLCWLAYILLCRDIEMACDEKVIRDMDKGSVAAYSQAILDCSFPRRSIAACPLAFGEVGVKERVKSVLNYKKPAFWIIVVAVVLCIVLAVCFLTNPQKENAGKLPKIYPYSYGVAEVTYEASGYNFSMVAQDNTPVYKITEDMMLMSEFEYSAGEWTELGSLSELELTNENFDNLFKSSSTWFSKYETAEYFRKNNAHAWFVIYQQEYLYYVLQQKNGEVLLAYGYNDCYEKNDPASDDSSIRWLYRLAKESSPAVSNIIDPTKDPNFSYDTAVEKFYEDDNNEYFFGGIYSEHVIVQYADGSEEDITAALCSGRASISDLDRFDIRYWAEPKQSSLEIALSQAILEHYAGSEPDGLIHVESHVILGKEEVSATPMLGSDKHEYHVTYYLLMHHEKFSTYGGELEVLGGSAGPVAITFINGPEEEYILEEYWEPRLGGYYTKDIREKFPAELAEKALSGQEHEAYMKSLKFENQNKAFYILNNSSSIDFKIGELLDTIMSSPLYSSASRDYIREHESEYNELIAYGKYTLQYCFSEFLKGGQTGLRGHIMASACSDIAAKWGEALAIDGIAPATGQGWFAIFRNNAETLAKQYSREDLEKYYPASFLLLQMSDSNFEIKE